MFAIKCTLEKAFKVFALIVCRIHVTNINHILAWTPRLFLFTGTCDLYGNSHIETFDGLTYQLNGKGSYVLSKHCHSTIGESSYEIRLNQKSPLACSTSESKCDKEIEILIGGKLAATLRMKPLLTIDGKEKRFYVDTIHGWKTGVFAGENIYFSSKKAGIYVLWNNRNELKIIADSSLFKQTCGLCGTFDNDITNDFHTHDEDTELSAKSFVSQWSLKSSAYPEGMWDEENYCDVHFNRKKDAEKSCKKLKEDPKFARCHKLVSPQKYFDLCMSDTCSSKEYYLQILRVYLRKCADKGTPFDPQLYFAEDLKRSQGKCCCFLFF